MLRGIGGICAAFTVSARFAECESESLLACAVRWKSPVEAFEAAPKITDVFPPAATPKGLGGLDVIPGGRPLIVI